MLQNIHLVARWLGTLEKRVEQHGMGSHADYRVFMSAEPAPSPEAHIIPQGLLENAIKITNEPPTGMYANLHKALDLFSQVPAPRSPRAAPPMLPAPLVPAEPPRCCTRSQTQAPSQGRWGEPEPPGLSGQGRRWEAAGSPQSRAAPRCPSQACRGCAPERVCVYRLLIFLVNNQVQ